MVVSNGDVDVAIYFSDFFSLDPDLIEDHGAFDISLINDLPLFVDPFLLFNSKKPIYQNLHREIIQYLQFLVRKAASGQASDDLLKLWFTFSEVKENWLGFSKEGNRGSGLGIKFAKALRSNLSSVFRDFGEEKITRGSHLEKLCLVTRGVGRDNISDFTVCLIKRYLLEYTQQFALKELDPSQIWTGMVPKVYFNYDTESWVSETFSLPAFGNSYVILTPRDILTKDDTWISRPDLLRRFDKIVDALENDALRAQLNNYLASQLVLDKSGTDKERKEQEQKAIEQAILKFPQIIEYYIQDRELNGDQATAVSSANVTQIRQWFVEKIREFAKNTLLPSGFYDLPRDSYEEAMERLRFFKTCLEDRDGYRIFYQGDTAIQRESDLQLAFKLVWYASVFDINSEVNDGRGPADFVVSFGSDDKTIIEFKLASNSKLKSGLSKQVEIYKKASGANRWIVAIVYFSAEEQSRVRKILSDLGLHSNPDIMLIDCRKDNKPSASAA